MREKQKKNSYIEIFDRDIFLKVITSSWHISVPTYVINNYIYKKTYYSSNYGPSYNIMCAAIKKLLRKNLIQIPT